ncbi:aminopeptidase [Candidatus Woesearchaeota archaeon]|nr:aminopeptidase [Candidatus Woesearchaeota archaeon]
MSKNPVLQRDAVLASAAMLVLKTCLGATKSDTVLVITDHLTRKIGEALAHAAQKCCQEIDLKEIPPLVRNAQEPPETVARQMQAAGVIILATAKSLSHTKARRDATAKGARIASMPGITEAMMARAVMTDYPRMKVRTEKLAKALEGAHTLLITTSLGTNLEMSIRGRKIFSDTGLYTLPKQWGNLPAGEVCLGPCEGVTNGILVVDSCMGTGLLSKPIKINIRKGVAIAFEGSNGNDEEAKVIQAQFDGFGEKGYSVAELGIGTNADAKLTGLILEDEKVLGTAHVALGNNLSFGGSIDVPVHIDGVFTKPTIIVDGKTIMHEGKLLIQD